MECWKATRWYEHLVGPFLTVAAFTYQRVKPVIRYSSYNIRTIRGVSLFVTCFSEIVFGQRGQARLQGRVNNEYECDKFGVLESPARLKQKAENWEKFAAYKEEWMKRFDYYVYGMRPGERFTFFSQLHVPPFRVRYNKRSDYPMRKNPYFLSTYSVKDYRLESPGFTHYPKGKGETPLEASRPETRYVWKGGVA